MDAKPREDLPAPIAARLRRPTWRDPRLLFGVLLVAGSVGLGSWAVAAGQQTVGVFRTTQPITPGQAVTTDDLAVTQIRADELESTYLMAGDGIPGDLVALRVLGQGELVPAAALGAASRMTDRAVSVLVAEPLPGAVTVGSQVDLWFVPETSPGATPANGPGTFVARSGPDGPQALATSLVVTEVAEDAGMLVGSGASVHVLVPEDRLGEVLGALAAPGTISVVPVPGGVG